ncbi:MAG: ABC transporter permease, partial [Anaerolineales bacterium]
MNTDVRPNLLRPRWRKVFSDLWDDKTRTSLVVASIAVGVFAIGVIVSAYVILGTDINRSYAAVNPPNIEVQTDPFDEDLVQAIKNVPGVKDAEGRRLVEIRARRGNENWQSLTLVGVSDFASNINHLDPIDGTSFPGKDEVIVSQEMLHVTGYHIGDAIEIKLPDGSKHTLTVVGLVTDQTTSKIDPNSPNNAYITMKTLSSLGLDWYFNKLYVTVSGNASDLENIAVIGVDVKEKVKRSQREVYQVDEKPSNEHPMTSLILAVLGILAALGGLITILSSSLIINTLNALLTQQLHQIGIMKLVGARSNQIMGMYLALIIAYSVIALFLAVPLGALAGYAMASFIANLIGAVLQGFRIIPLAVVIQMLIAIGVPLGAGFFPVSAGAKTSVQEAISNYRPGGQAAKRSFLSLQAKWFNWISRPILLSFRNTFRKRGRLLFTIFTLTVGGAVFIAVFNVRDSLSTVTDQVTRHFMGDVTVDFRRPYRVSEIEHDLLGIPGVAGVEGWTGTSGEIRDANDKVVSNLSVVAPPQDTRLLRAEFLAGRWLLPGENSAIVVSDTIYKFYPNLKPGDRLIV